MVVGLVGVSGCVVAGVCVDSVIRMCCSWWLHKIQCTWMWWGGAGEWVGDGGEFFQDAL